MIILPQLERELLAAAERRLAAGAAKPVEATGGSRRSRDVRARMRRFRVPLLALGLSLATATITLAATGVIPIGKPVHPEEVLNPGVGEGIPAPGASRLLPLRVPDPAGGPPWGMRLVRTTRGELCVQIGRVQDGQLGELGIDGNFHNDGRFHPLPADALPADSSQGSLSDIGFSANASCHLPGSIQLGDFGVAPSAAPRQASPAKPGGDLREIYYGILGSRAVSITYRSGGSERTVPVHAPLGAYLIVLRAPAGQYASGAGTGGREAESQPYPPLVPDLPLTEFTYRIDGKLCEPLPHLHAAAPAHVLARCPMPSGPPRPAASGKLNVPLHVKLRVSHAVVLGASLSFNAPYGIRSARHDYSYLVTAPHLSSEGLAGCNVGSALARDVRRGELVTWELADPFAYSCGQRSALIEVYYGRGRVRSAPGESTLVGSITVTEPPGSRPGPPPGGWPQRAP